MIDKFKEVAIRASKQAGEILKLGFNNVQYIKNKNKHDIVSNVDYESESEIKRIIKEYFPEQNILAEESANENRNSEFSWYIDPLDGTSNFVTGNPYFSVSIALAQKNEVIWGVVYNSVLNELYYAIKDRGAFLNDKKIKVSNIKDLSNAFIASAYSSREDDIKKGLKVIEKFALRARRVLINFSPALDLCNIARGHLEAIVDNGTTPEDHAAGSLVVKEAGGMIQNYNSLSWNVNRTGIVASNGKLHDQIKKLL